MKEWKASEKEAQKMTRDGAISVNMVTGEARLPPCCIIIIAPNKRGYFSKKVPFRYGVFLTV